MKKTLLTLSINFIVLSGFAQWNQNGNNSSTGFLTLGNSNEMGDGKRHLTLLGSDKAKSYMNIHFNFNNRLSAFLHSTTPDGNTTDLLFYTAPLPNSYFERLRIKGNGNVGIGTADPQYRLDVNGKFYLRAVDKALNGWTNSYFYHQGHNLIIGSPAGQHTHNSLELKPTGTDKGLLYSKMTMFVTPKTEEYIPKVQIHTYGNSYFNGGNVGIGTDNPKNLLDVNGTIRAKEVKVELENWSDFVFDKDYKLPSLQEVETHINEHKHLPDIPSEKQVKEEGVNLAEMQAKLLQKIEELTLYVIKQEKKIEEQNKQIEKLEHILINKK